MQTEFAAEIYRSRNQYEQQKQWRTLFHRVLEAYIEARNLPAICAVVYDDEIPPNRKLSVHSIHFVTDIEHAIAKATGDDTGLRELWWRLVDGEELSSAAAARLAVKAGRIFDIRGLSPHLYFRNVKRGRKDRFVPSGVAI
jgi:hypothetical protein